METPVSTWMGRWVRCRLMGPPFFEVMKAYDKAASHGVQIDWETLVTHRLVSGSLDSLISGLIYAKERGVKMSIACACARDLYARAKYELCLKDWLQPVIDAGIDDISKAPL